MALRDYHVFVFADTPSLAEMHGGGPDLFRAVPAILLTSCAIVAFVAFLLITYNAH